MPPSWILSKIYFLTLWKEQKYFDNIVAVSCVTTLKVVSQVKVINEFIEIKIFLQPHKKTYIRNSFDLFWFDLKNWMWFISFLSRFEFGTKVLLLDPTKLKESITSGIWGPSLEKVTQNQIFNLKKKQTDFCGFTFCWYLLRWNLSLMACLAEMQFCKKCYRSAKCLLSNFTNRKLPFAIFVVWIIEKANNNFTAWKENIFKLVCLKTKGKGKCQIVFDDWPI